MIDAVIEGNVAVAVERLRGMFAQDKSTEYTVIGAFAYHFHRMFDAKVLLNKGVRQKDITDKFRLWSYKDKFFTQLKKMSLKKIGGYLQRLTETDYAIKTGQTKTPVAMEQFVLQISIR